MEGKQIHIYYKSTGYDHDKNTEANIISNVKKYL